MIPPPAGVWGRTLPVPLNSFVGRAREAAELAALLRGGERLVTLTGAGGTGKTRLALEVAAAARTGYEGGVFLAMLAPLGRAGDVLPALAAAVGMSGGGGDPLSRLTRVLAEAHALLVLDNFEHVLDAAPPITDLLQACSRLQCLITSRAPLRVRGEREYPVSPFETTDAVRLFADRAAAVRAESAVEEDPAAAEICARLDGLPLAIELAAARVRLFTPTQLLARLDADGRLPLLIGGARDLPARQRTLRDTMARSEGLLGPTEQSLFARLGVFSDSFTPDAVVQVCADVGEGAGGTDRRGVPSADVVGCLEELVSFSLVQRDEDHEGATVGSDEPRFSLLETVREYALERLEERGELHTLLRRHAEHYVALCEESVPMLDDVATAGPDGLPALLARQRAWLARLAAEGANIRAAFDYAEQRVGVRAGAERAAAAGLGMRLLAAMRDAATHPLGGWGEALERQERFLAATRDLPPGPEREQVVGGLARLARAGRGPEDAARLRAYSEEWAAIQRAVPRAWYTDRVADGWLAVARDRLGDRAGALEALESGVAFARTLGPPADAAWLAELAWAAAFLGLDSSQAALLDEAAARIAASSSPDPWVVARMAFVRAVRAPGVFDPVGARCHLEEALARYEALGAPFYIAFYRNQLGDEAFAGGDLARARTHYEEAGRIHAAWGSEVRAGRVRARIALLAHLQGDTNEARSALVAALGTAARTLEPIVVERTALAAGHALCELGDHRLGVALLAAHAALKRASVWHTIETGGAERSLRAARVRLGKAAYEAALREGETAPLPELLARALSFLEHRHPRAVTRGAASRAPADRLTTREHEVAALVAAGLTNRQIAERLVLSERTVENHLQRIMAKLGARNRAQVAAWTATHSGAAA
jgi:predicted ATPase/DNA-binding CsgD family transcriptional regulator